jgi:cell division protease FtsH
MDGFAASGVVVLAATNRPDLLDAALTRPGRLDRQVQVPAPDRRGREQILVVHTRGRTLAPDVDMVTVARQTPGMSGADLARVVNEACTAAARRGRADVDASCFAEAVAVVAMGRARTSALVTEHDRRITAWHEAGHTVAALVQPDADDPVSVTIVPRGPQWRRHLDGRQRQQLPHPQPGPRPAHHVDGRPRRRRRCCSTANTPRAPRGTCTPRRDWPGRW